MNPPYSQPLIDNFCEKLSLTVAASGVSAVTLVNNSTESRWFQSLCGVASAICFPKGRVRFFRPNGEIGTPLQGQALIYCGSNPVKFKSVFMDFGLVVSK